MANIFDRDGDGYIDYKEFVSALRPNRDVSISQLAGSLISSYQMTGCFEIHTTKTSDIQYMLRKDIWL